MPCYSENAKPMTICLKNKNFILRSFAGRVTGAAQDDENEICGIC